ncbi:retrotransposon ty1-copia subclass [Plasmopara halstedii]|uniref:Retrotransposon ty1-copia subclass n=1 Tax=Plasmopara halstedii TaxID=4781 RepID=A0A0N7L8P3_PLAHL|nr:retrotransposon ty1-copia subclass [Plasmopara halstedii]CEG50435.1 retrotransposon ty1-copia subclass [Plasmopara halstedii]|eukprot:XP_024586804.1 retrotransposon ty1-copia subclass [Plasmopara halstedii]
MVLDSCTSASSVAKLNISRRTFKSRATHGAAFAVEEERGAEWLIDNEAKSHMIHHRCDLSDNENLDVGPEVTIAGGKKLGASRKGIVRLRELDGADQNGQGLAHSDITCAGDRSHGRDGADETLTMGGARRRAFERLDAGGFAKKRNELGQVVRYKTRLVDMGYKQKFDLFEASPFVADMDSIKIVLAVAVAMGYVTELLDVDTAFLNIDLKEEVYMEKPHIIVAAINMMCKLNKETFDLRQAASA